MAGIRCVPFGICVVSLWQDPNREMLVTRIITMTSYTIDCYSPYDIQPEMYSTIASSPDLPLYRKVKRLTFSFFPFPVERKAWGRGYSTMQLPRNNTALVLNVTLPM